jgi:hypothetical protein
MSPVKASTLIASPTVKARVGPQNVTRVLSNASSPPAKLIDLNDVNSDSQNIDGLLLVWNLENETFIMTSVIDNEVKISDPSESYSATTGALVVSGGVGIGGNLNVAGIATFGTGTVVIDGDNDTINVGTAVTISSSEGIFTPALQVNGQFKAESLNISGISTLASNGGITTTGGNLYVGENLEVAGTSNFIGTATFRGGTINLGDGNTDDINVIGEFISNLIPNVDDTYNLGSSTKRWKNVFTSGITTTNNLFVVGVSTFTNTLNITGFVTVTEGLYYDADDYDGPNGIAYFDNTGKLISADSSTTETLTTTNLILTTNDAGLPRWSSVIDGGEF